MYGTVGVRVSHRHTKVENSRVCLERHYWAEVESVKQKELSSVNRRTVVNNQQSYNWVYAVHCLRTEPRKLCCCAVRLHCVFMGIYCQRSSDSAINDHCADLLQALSLLFTEKAVSIVYPRQRPHVAL